MEIFKVTDTTEFPDIKALVLIHPDGKTVTQISTVSKEIADRIKAAIGQRD